MRDLLALSQAVGDLLKAQKRTIATAESCTGGLIASTLTDISGSSVYVTGGFVTYSNEAKMTLLGVKEATLIAFGAVSEQTASEMAVGALDRLDVDIALSATGIAGPNGGSPDKPVGLVYIGVSWRVNNRIETLVKRYVWNSDRIQNKIETVFKALQLTEQILQKLV